MKLVVFLLFFIIFQPTFASESKNKIRIVEQDLVIKVDCTVSKITDQEDLKEDMPRFDNYIGVFTSEYADPLGVYKLEVNGKIVGCQSFVPDENNSLIEEMTDIFLIYQGLGYGTTLRTETAKLFRTHLAETKFLYSCCEWGWGTNPRALKSSYNAGYGVVFISMNDANEGNVQMLYPQKIFMWPDGRVKNLLKASEAISKNNPKLYVRCLVDILRDLDLYQDRDIITYCSVIKRLQDAYEDNEDYQKFLGNIGLSDLQSVRNYGENKGSWNCQQFSAGIFENEKENCRNVFYTILFRRYNQIQEFLNIF